MQTEKKIFKYQRQLLNSKGVMLPTGEKSEIHLIPRKKIKNAVWSSGTARIGDEVTLSVDTQGYEEGTPVIFNIFEQDNDGRHNFIEAIESVVENGCSEAQWTYRLVTDEDDIVSPSEDIGGCTIPEYYFTATVEEEEISSDWLEYRNWINIVIRNSDGNPASNIGYTLFTSEGEREGTTDSEGRISEDDLPQGDIKIKFANGKRIQRT